MRPGVFVCMTLFLFFLSVWVATAAHIHTLSLSYGSAMNPLQRLISQGATPTSTSWVLHSRKRTLRTYQSYQVLQRLNLLICSQPTLENKQLITWLDLAAPVFHLITGKRIRAESSVLLASCVCYTWHQNSAGPLQIDIWGFSHALSSITKLSN